MKVRGFTALVSAILLTVGVPLSATAAPPDPGHESGAGLKPQASVSCSLPESNAEALEILNNYFPNRYWWDHTNLTVAIQAHPSATPEQLDAIRGAITTWDTVLRDCFDGLITLTDVTGTQPSEQRAADIVVHFVPKAGGVVFGGFAVCGAQGCPNIIVRSDFPQQLREDYTPEFLRLVTLHELGHALGLGHATNLLESTDLMGYGWPELGEPVLSDCDVDAIAYIFAWALNGTAPARPGPGPYDCSQD